MFHPYFHFRVTTAAAPASYRPHSGMVAVAALQGRAAATGQIRRRTKYQGVAVAPGR